MSEREPSEEELRAALEEQMRSIRVEDIIVQTAVTLVNLAARRLGLAGEDDAKDLGQARLAIDAARALAPLFPQESAAPIRDALAQLQMAFAREGSGAAAEQEPVPTSSGEAAAPQQQPAGDAERAKTRSKIWTPPGS